jgi:transposase
MKILPEQLKKIEKHLPVPRRKSSIGTLNFLNAVLYLVENGCKWRALPKEFGDWHVICVRFNDWCKKGVWQRVFSALQAEGVISLETMHVCLDSTTIKVHPDSTGALKKAVNKPLDGQKAD